MLKQALITANGCLAFVSSNFVSLLGLFGLHTFSVATSGWLMFVVHDFSTAFRFRILATHLSQCATPHWGHYRHFVFNG